MRGARRFRDEGIVDTMSRSETVVQRSRQAAIPCRSRRSVRNAGITRPVLLTLSAALLLAAAPIPPPGVLTSIPTRDQKIIHRWSVSGDPRGLAIGHDGTLYV